MSYTLNERGRVVGIEAAFSALPVPGATDRTIGPRPRRSRTNVDTVDTTTVDFHFDVMCPWAYQTSLWMRDVRDQLGLTVNWRFFSLEEVNRPEGKKHPWERQWSYGWSMMRIGAALRRDEGMAALDAWYERAGRALHVEGHKPHQPEVARHLLAEIGHDPAIVEAAIADPATGEEVKVEHDHVIRAGGFGVPTLFFGDQALFGPVLIDPPSGDAALRLWSAVTSWVEFPHLYELQRPRSSSDERLIAETFRPYLEARDWVSINRGKVVGFTGNDVAGDEEDGPTGAGVG